MSLEYKFNEEDFTTKGMESLINNLKNFIDCIDKDNSSVEIKKRAYAIVNSYLDQYISAMKEKTKNSLLEYVNDSKN
jgi:hypothetical protein